MSQSSSLLSLLHLPRELIYKIAGEDAAAYNRILRLCRYISSLFPLSTRLDFMEGFGVTVRVTSIGTFWFWGSHLHDVYGPAMRYINNNVNNNISYYYHGSMHRLVRPASLATSLITWVDYDSLHRDPTAPAGTGVEWLRGAVNMYVHDDGFVVEWWDNGEFIRGVDGTKTSDEYKQVCAEIAYWRALE